ncbi:Uncharacterized protein dnl_22350 [Desulfonema limicola]|uniref:Uncharacterized protein n=1 Tax=Desulfonema limicola TaxID=45656 RepID=A0A975B6Y6_9BACT|nr:hypothetical protein [Desulfonema limicola]QTA79951.1 Uncharacterized protein dnl_22350 [Desulfonema limicola]
MRFVQEHLETGICVFSGKDMFMMTVLHKQVTDLSGEDPTEAYRQREDKPESLAQQNVSFDSNGCQAGWFITTE